MVDVRRHHPFLSGSRTGMAFPFCISSFDSSSPHVWPSSDLPLAHSYWFIPTARFVFGISPITPDTSSGMGVGRVLVFIALTVIGHRSRIPFVF